MPNFFPKLLPASPVGLEPICLPRFTGPLPSFYFSLVSFVFRKDLPVRNSVFQVFTIFVPRQHHHQPENRPVREPVSAPRRFSCRSFAPSLFSVAFALFSVLNFRHSFLLCCKLFLSPFPHFSLHPLFFSSSLIVQKNYSVRIAFTGPLPSFLLLVCFICFPQRPSCPKFRLRGLYNLCPFPASPSARKPTCPRTCLGPASFFLPIFCSFSIFCRFRVVFGFKFQALFSSLLRNCKLFLSPLPLFSFLFFPSSLVVRKNYPVHNAFTWPLPSFLRFACIVRFPQRPSCPKFRLRGLYNLCSLPTSPSARKPTCPSICLSFASFFLPIFCPNSIFYRFRVVFGF